MYFKGNHIKEEYFMKPVPLSKKQEDKIISNLDPVIQEKYNLFRNIVLNGDTESNNYETLAKELGVHDVYDNVTLYRKLNLVVFNDSTFELLEATKSGNIIKFRDGTGRERRITEKDYAKINKERPRKVNPPKPPKSRMGQDALKKLSGSGG